MGRNKIRKLIERDTTFIEKNTIKHHHDYSIECLLEVTNINKHASGCLYQIKSYYHVMKCSICNSFKSIQKEGNSQGHIWNDELSYELKKLPLIKADTARKNPIYSFQNLINIKYEGHK